MAVPSGISSPYRPYAGKSAPSALQIVDDLDMKGRLSHKTILITGCTSGIGVETARALYETGAKLFLTARNMPKIEQIIDDIVLKSSIDAPRPESIELRLDSLVSVKKAAEEFKQKSGGRLHILINNAGVAALPYTLTEDGFEAHLGTNHFAHFFLFILLKDSLIKSASVSGTTSRIINLTSGGHVSSDIRYNDLNFKIRPYSKFPAYGQSKTANVLMTKAIVSKFSSVGLTGLAVHPGEIDTELYRHMEDVDYELVGGKEAFRKLLKSPEQGAATTVWAALEPYFEDIGKGGQFLADVGEGWVYQGKEAVAKYAVDDDNAERLWKVSCEAVGVKNE